MNLLGYLVAGKWSGLVFYLSVMAIYTYCLFNGMAVEQGIAVMTGLTFAYIVGLFSIYGSPKHWWAIWFGTTLTVDPKRVCTNAQFKNSTILAEAINIWIETAKPGLYYKHNSFKYQFFHKRDATMFKLTWL